MMLRLKQKQWKHIWRFFCSVIAVLLIAATPYPPADQWLQHGNTQYEAGQVEAAIQSWQRAQKQYQQHPNPSAEKVVLEKLGTAYVQIEQYQAAIPPLEALLPLARSHQNQPLEANTLGNLGIAYRALGRYSDAVQVYKEAGKLMVSLGNRQGLGQVFNNLGNVYETLGDFEKAQTLYQQSLSIAQDINDAIGKATSLGNLGVIYANLNQFNKAIALHQQSLNVYQQLDDQSGYVSGLINLGSVYHAQGNYRQAFNSYNQAVNRARTIRDRRRESEALMNLGMAYEDLKQYPKAIETYQASVAIARKLADPKLISAALNNLGHGQYNANDLKAAEITLREAIHILNRLRPDLNDFYQVSIFDTQVHTYNLLQQVLVAANQPEAALEISELGRARAFVELLAKSHKNQTIQRVQANTLAPLTIGKIRSLARQQQLTIVEYAIVPDDNFKFRGKQRGRAERLLIWVVQPSGQVTLRQVPVSYLWKDNRSLTDLITSVRIASGIRGRSDTSESLQPGDLVRRKGEPLTWQPYKIISVQTEEGTVSLHHPDFQLPAPVPISEIYKVAALNPQQPQWQQLHQILIAPIADLLPTNPNDPVMFVPQEQLFLVPFAALQDASNTYLIEKHTVLTAPAIQILSLLPHQSKQVIRSAQPSLVIGNPVPMPAEFSPLPNAEIEAQEVAQMLQTQPLIGQLATEATVKQKLASASIIHLATHGILNEQNSLRSAIVLAPSADQDGLLTAEEILQLPLNAELVVLSACDTGRGQITGDGVLGLSRSILAAGASSVVVSLWQVPDQATSKLMVEFYRDRQTGINNAQALRQAMLKTKQSFPNPVNWAAFTSIGLVQ